MTVNPILPGFNPDPSIVRVDGVYYLVTSTFEYLPGMPVYRSEDLEDWTLIGHVATREEQIGIRHSPTPGGVFAPTIRFHDGRFHVIVSVMFNARGCVVFTADRPEGPWSDGVEIPAVDGIDPDLAWDDDGVAYVTYAVMGQGIRQVRVDLETGEALSEPRPLWSGTGLHAPEGPHLYRRGDDWYLLIAEGGTERGHTVAIARGTSPEGPFEGFAGNPILTARSTSSAVQNVGHADLVEAPDGGTAHRRAGCAARWVHALVLAARPRDLPHARGVGRRLAARRADRGRTACAARSSRCSTRRCRSSSRGGSPSARRRPRWRRSTPRASGADRARHRPRRSAAQLRRSPPGAPRCDLLRPGRRDRLASAALPRDTPRRTGSAIDAHDDGSVITVTARAALAGFTHEWRAKLPSGDVVLSIRSRASSSELGRLEVGGDRIQLVAASVARSGRRRSCSTELDGRYWAYETTESFTGRVLGLYAIDGTVAFST